MGTLLARKEKAERLLQSLMQEKMLEANALLATVEHLEGLAMADGPPQQRDAQEACSTARSRLEEVVGVILPRMLADGPLNLDLTRNEVSFDQGPEASKIMEEVVMFVRDAEAKSKIVVKVRKDFEKEVRTSLKERSELRAFLREMQAELEAAGSGDLETRDTA